MRYFIPTKVYDEKNAVMNHACDLELFVPRDSAEDLTPSFRTLGVSKYVSYTVILVFLMCLAFFSLEAFNLYNWMQLVTSILGSTVLTAILILVIENVRNRR